MSGLLVLFLVACDGLERISDEAPYLIPSGLSRTYCSIAIATKEFFVPDNCFSLRLYIPHQLRQRTTCDKYKWHCYSWVGNRIGLEAIPPASNKLPV